MNPTSISGNSLFVTPADPFPFQQNIFITPSSMSATLVSSILLLFQDTLFSLLRLPFLQNIFFTPASMSATLVSSIPLPFQETFFTSLPLRFQENIFITPGGSWGIHAPVTLISYFATSCSRRIVRDELPATNCHAMNCPDTLINQRPLWHALGYITVEVNINTSRIDQFQDVFRLQPFM